MSILQITGSNGLKLIDCYHLFEYFFNLLPLIRHQQPCSKGFKIRLPFEILRIIASHFNYTQIVAFPLNAFIQMVSKQGNIAYGFVLIEGDGGVPPGIRQHAAFQLLPVHSVVQ